MNYNIPYDKSYIIYDDRIYLICNTDISFAKNLIISDINTYSMIKFPGEKSEKYSVVFQIINGVLNIVYFKCIIAADDLNKLKSMPYQNYELKDTTISLLYETTSNERLYDTQSLSGYEVCFDELMIPYAFNGRLSAAQLCEDEVYNGIPVKGVSKFEFTDGKLSLEKSSITSYNETFISRFTWGSPNAEKGRRQYYIEPVGIVAQHEYLLSLHVNYKLSGDLPRKLIDAALEYPQPIFRYEYMCLNEETEEYADCECDLVLDFVERLDLERLRWIYDYIQFDKYPYYPNWMIYQMFNVLRNNNGNFDWNKCIEMLIFLFRKDFKCTNAAEIIEEIKSLAPDNDFQASLAARYIKEMGKK